jgi:hypothetical protein
MADKAKLAVQTKAIAQHLDYNAELASLGAERAHTSSAPRSAGEYF